MNKYTKSGQRLSKSLRLVLDFKIFLLIVFRLYLLIGCVDLRYILPRLLEVVHICKKKLFKIQQNRLYWSGDSIHKTVIILHFRSHWMGKQKKLLCEHTGLRNTQWKWRRFEDSHLQNRIIVKYSSTS